MSSRNVITRDLADSIRACLGRKVKLTLKVLVKAEVKGDKTENRVLAFASCRLFVLTTKFPTRVDQHFHYLDIQGVESKKPNQLCLMVYDRIYSYYTVGDDKSSHEVDTMVLTLATALKNIFPSVPLTHIIRKVEIHPSSRMQSLDELERATLGGTRDIGPCGGFSTQYMCMCDYHALPYREEVAWDVDTIYLSHDTRELYLHDFDYLDQKDLIPIISVLEYNTWFRKLRVSHSRLSHEAIERILHVVSKSLSIEEIFLDNIGAKAEFVNKLSLSLLSNSSLPLQKLDLSHNPIEDKGVTNLCGVVAKLAPFIPGGAVHISHPFGRQAKGLAHLDLSCCSLTSKGVNMLSHSLNVNKYMSQTLTYVSLAGNNLKDDTSTLFTFLAQPNVLKTLDLSTTECAIDAVFGALLRGCTSSLVNLNLSRNNFGSRKSREMLPSYKQYFTSTLALKVLNLSQCKLPADALKNVLLGLACNENISDVELDISYNQLGATGAQILESCIHGVRCLSSLLISDNGLESQLGPVVMAMSKNKSLKKINISRNLNNIKSKHVGHVMDAVVHMIQEEDCVLESLSISDSKLKADIHSLLNALGSNHCLRSLDISGNMMGDSGARLLAKALQINSKLQYISYDRNNITLTGYSDIAYALQSNYSMKYMPYPVHDSMICMKTAPDRTEILMRKIQDTLYRNVSPMKYSNGQAFRLQQGFLLSSAQQQVDRLVLQTSEAMRSLKRGGAGVPGNLLEGDAAASLMEQADGYITDAENSKQLISHLHDIVVRRDDAGNPIETRLCQLAQDVHTVITNYLQDTVESMVRSAQHKCPNVLCEERIVDDIRQDCLVRSQFSSHLIEESIVEQAGSVILNKVNEVKLAVASTLSDRVVDEVVDALSKTCKNLQTGEGPRKRASTGADLSGRDRITGSELSRNERSPDNVSQDDSASQKSDPSPLATPQLASKRKSHHGRKLRPQSVVAESLDSVSELPSSCGQLQHLGKARPRRTKTRAPTRPLGHADVLEEDHDISEGVDTFFRPGSATPTTPLISPDSENSPHLTKFSSASSMESFPPTGGARTGSEKGSIESLTRSESVIPYESDVNRESPKFHSHSREEEEYDDETDTTETASLDERRNMSIRMGRLSSDSSKQSPEMAMQKGIMGVTAEDKSYMDDEEDGVSQCRSSGSQKYGVSSNFLSEIRARQEKRSSVLQKEEEKDALSSHLLPGLKLRSAGLGENAKSPTNGFPRTSSANRDSANLESGLNLTSSTKTVINSGLCKTKGPPPLAPKPRPKSAAVSSDAVPGLSPELLLALDKRRSTLTSNQMEQLEESLVDSESSFFTSSPLSPKPNDSLSPQDSVLHRQTSHKHVASPGVDVDDTVDV